LADWKIYTGSGAPHDDITEKLPEPPPWRKFAGAGPLPVPAEVPGSRQSAVKYLASEEAVRQVNAALYLRRPLLVTGPPGTGKSTLAYAVAHELKLGPVLHWPITSRATLREGLYEYDPLSRLEAASGSARMTAHRRDAADPRPYRRAERPTAQIGDYIRLGPLGTALLPYQRPRVLLIDEIDKSDIDLPNDLLTIFETGSYEIIELARAAVRTAWVMTADSTTSRAPVHAGTVTCDEFPLVIMTSNGEREFPPAFLRRCLTLSLKQPESEDDLRAIVREHLGTVLRDNGAAHSSGNDGQDGDDDGRKLPAQARDIISHFFQRRSGGMLANDQLLNAIYLCRHAMLDEAPADVLQLADQVMPYLSTEAGGDGD
jgi:MoxR-like ATPase